MEVTSEAVAQGYHPFNRRQIVTIQDLSQLHQRGVGPCEIGVASDCLHRENFSLQEEIAVVPGEDVVGLGPQSQGLERRRQDAAEIEGRLEVPGLVTQFPSEAACKGIDRADQQVGAGGIGGRSG